MRALEQVSSWPVGRAAVGVTDASGTVGAIGPTEAQFALASVTKPLTGLAVLVAAEEEILALDDAAGPPGSTVRHLLAHASGIAPDNRTVLTPPGRRRIYSNTGYEVLGELVEERSGMPFGQYLHEAVAVPLDLGATVLEGESPASGAISSVDDLLVVARALLSDPPRLLATTTIAEARDVAFPGLAGVLPGFGSQNPNDWGLGFEVRGHKAPHWTGSASSPATFGHFGRSGTFLWIDPDAGLACACLTDRDFGPWALDAWPRLTDAILQEG
jgi:CubicO group peptidase (beta-lactamase class C family)